MNTVTVYSKKDFRENIQEIKNNVGVAVISIEGSDNCIKHYLEPIKKDFDNQHLLESSQNVLNVNFDDLTEDTEYDGVLFKAITEEQANEIFNFIDQHLGYNFIIHCKAGQSRSQAVGKFILDVYKDKYKSGRFGNPCITPNIKVLAELNAAFYRKYNIYQDQRFSISKSNRTQIIEEAARDSGKYVHFRFFDINSGNPDEVRTEDIVYLLGAVDGTDDYYWVYLNRENKVYYHSCVGGYSVIDDNNRGDYPNVDYEKARFLDTASVSEKQELINSVKITILNNIKNWASGNNLFWEENNEEIYNDPIKGILYLYNGEN